MLNHDELWNRESCGGNVKRGGWLSCRTVEKLQYTAGPSTAIGEVCMGLPADGAAWLVITPFRSDYYVVRICLACLFNVFLLFHRCTRWFLPLLLLPLPTAPPFFLVLFLLSLTMHAKPWSVFAFSLFRLSISLISDLVSIALFSSRPFLFHLAIGSHSL